MPAFAGQFDWRLGLIWQVGFVAAEARNPGQGILHICPALVDTGASETCVSREVARELHLQPTGKIDMNTAGGVVAVNVYDVQLAILLGSRSDGEGNLMQEGELFGPVRAPEFDPGDNPYKALIGRDVLHRGVLNLSFDAHYSFSY